MTFLRLSPRFLLVLFVLQVVSINAAATQPSSIIETAIQYRYTLIAELETGELHVYERTIEGKHNLVETFQVSIGKSGYGKEVEGDNKTPVGVYRITSYLNREQLDDFYGNAAYPVNYPNAWDRLQKRSGYGIWIHAEPIGFLEKTRPLLDSNGCVVLSNNDIDKIAKYINVGYTYVILTPRVELVETHRIESLRSDIARRLAAWKSAWESLDNDLYLGFYSTKFNNLEKDWQAWVDYKKRIHAAKYTIKIGLSDLGIYAYPGLENTLWVEFYQSYNSNNYRSKGWKRQLWQQEADGEWRIIYEGGG